MKLAMPFFATMVMFASVGKATPISNGTGLANPSKTIDFNASELMQDASIDAAYTSQGVTFSNLFQDAKYSGYFPNISGGEAGNFTPNSPAAPFNIWFSHAVDEAAFALMISRSPAPSIIESFLNGVLVETASVFTSRSNSDNFYGFSDSLFDQIKVTPETAYGGAALIDQLQFTTDVPEPVSLALLSSGLIGLGLVRRRRG